MQVTDEELREYEAFAGKIAKDFGCNQPPQGLIWHYTDGEGLIAIVESGCLHASQIAALNDKNETRLGTQLYLNSIGELSGQYPEGSEQHSFLAYIQEALKEDPDNPTHGNSTAYICSFSGHRDELTQWERYGRRSRYLANWGYALGFDKNLARNPASLIKVIYSRAAQEQAANALAEATLHFYTAGLNDERRQDLNEWRSSFFSKWDNVIYPLAAAAKDECWEPENEYRIHLDVGSLAVEHLGFKQRNSMMSRHFKLRPSLQDGGGPGLLPIREIMIGPGNQPHFTKLNLQLLLEQKGYHQVEISQSSITLQNP